MRSRALLATSLLQILGVQAISAALTAAQTQVSRVSVDGSGHDSNGESAHPALTGDGLVIAFESTASDLVPLDANGVSDIFVLDRAEGTLTRISMDSNGVEANGPSTAPAISNDGSLVVFASTATNLVQNDTNGCEDVFQRDRVTGKTILVSVSTNFVPGDAPSFEPAISGDGHFVVFTSLASTFANDTNGLNDIYLWDNILKRTTRVSAGFTVSGSCRRPSLSYDGFWVAFDSTGYLGPAPDTNGGPDVFIRDPHGVQLIRLSNTPGGAANGISRNAHVSADGAWIAFESRASDLVPNDTNARFDVFVYEFGTNNITRASVLPGAPEIEGNGDSTNARLSTNGDRIVFESRSANFAANDTNNVADVFLAHFANASLRCISRGPHGEQGDAEARTPSMSGDGGVVAYASSASNYVEDDLNGLADVFAATPYISTVDRFCFGDGVSNDCPCGNSGARGRGCANSVQSGGALLSGQGFASLSADSLLVHGEGMPPTSTCLYFQGTEAHDGGAGTVFGDGVRCLFGPLRRLGTKANENGRSGYGAPLGDVPISVRGLVPAGATRVYQIWYRDSASFCTSYPFNLTNGASTTWLP